jgi:hypothetical protein
MDGKPSDSLVIRHYRSLTEVKSPQALDGLRFAVAHGS